MSATLVPDGESLIVPWVGSVLTVRVEEGDGDDAEDDDDDDDDDEGPQGKVVSGRQSTIVRPRCKDGLSPGFPAAPERDVYDHSALPVFPRRFRTFRTRFTKVPAEGKLRQVCRSFVSLIHMFPCCFLVRIWLLDLGFMFLVCLLTSSLGLRRFYVLDLVISPAVGSRHPHVCSMVK